MTESDQPSRRAALEKLRQRLSDRYVIERELGRGGMGAVYLGRDVRLDRYVALKVLPPEYAAQPALRDRFLRETRTAAGFSHPNIVPVYAVEESDDLLAYAMGYVEGESLQERVGRAGPLSVREMVKLMQDVAYALGYAHGRGIVHRDIKPDNIMIERASGRALVMDFGIARGKSNAPVTTAGLTRVGEVVGTPEYMSPEQASGDDVDGRSDLYALGLTMLFAATGKNAVSAESTQKVLVKQLTETVPPAISLRADLPEVLAAAIDRCVLKEPSERFSTAEELVDTLDNSKLIAAEIPLPIRLFQQDASALTFIFFAFACLSWYIVQSVSRRGSGNEELLLVAALISIAITRTLQTMREARRLALLGFSPSEIILGLSRVADEQATRRMDLRADPSTVRLRRRSVLVGITLVLLSIAALKYAIDHRDMNSMGEYQLRRVAALMVVFAAVGLGSGFVLILKSPLRMSMAERLFRAVWLSAFGRAFIRFSGRNVKSRGVRTLVSGDVRATGHGVNVTRPVPARADVPAAVVQSISNGAGTEARFAQIEKRLDALERRK